MVKVLECSKCHHHFKSTTMHMMVRLESGKIINFCNNCAERFSEFAEVGMNVKDLMEKYPELKTIMKDYLRLVDWEGDALEP